MTPRVIKLVQQAPEEIRRHLSYREYPCGASIFPAPGQMEYLYIIDSGVVEVIKESYSGTLISVNAFTEGDIMGEIEIFCPELTPYKVNSKTACRLLVIPKATVFQWMQADFDFTHFICETMARRLYTTSDSMSRIAMLPLKQRILGCIHAQYQAGTLSSFTKEMLVEQTKAPLRSVNRIIRACIDSGIIDYRKKTFYVLDEAALEVYAKEYEI